MKYQSIIAFSLLKAGYIALTLVVKELTWLYFLLTKLGLLLSNNQYTKIKVLQGCIGVKEIKVNLRD